LVPLLLGCGLRLFDHLGSDAIKLEKIRVVAAPGVDASQVPRRQVTTALSTATLFAGVSPARGSRSYT